MTAEIFDKFTPDEVAEFTKLGINDEVQKDDMVGMYFMEMQPNPLLTHSQIVGLFQSRERNGFLEEAFDILMTQRGIEIDKNDIFQIDEFKDDLLDILEELLPYKKDAKAHLAEHEENGNTDIEVNFTDELDFSDLPEENSTLPHLKNLLAGLDSDRMLAPLASISSDKMTFASERGLLQKLINDLAESDFFGSMVFQLRIESEAATEQILKSNWRLPVKPAKRYMQSADASFIDLLQEGNLGISKATNKYNYRSGYQFSTYAYWWVRQSVSKSFKKNQGDLSIPMGKREVMRKIYKVRQRLLESASHTDVTDYEPTNQQVIELYNTTYVDELNEDSLVQFDEIAERMYAKGLDSPIGDGDRTHMDYIPSEVDQEEEVIESVASQEVQSLLEMVFEGDSETNVRRKLVLQMRYGIPPYDRPHTFDEIASALDVSGERIRQIEGEAVNKMVNDSRVKNYGKDRQYKRGRRKRYKY